VSDEDKMYCIHCWIEVEKTEFKQVVGREKIDTWKHKTLRSPSGTGWCGRAVLRVEDIGTATETDA
jgi:hypothetical protein